MPTGSLRIATALAIVALASSARAEAAAIFNVTVDTASLAVAPGSASGPFSLFFQLTDGSGAGNGNNTVTLSDFAFSGGAVVPGTELLDGGASGDVGTAVTMIDSSFFSFFLQEFTPGSQLSFLVNLTTNLNGPGDPPDAFAFSILDGAGSPVPTLDPAFADTLLVVNVDSARPAIATYGTDALRTSLVVSGPLVDPVNPVPEPATLILTGLGMGIAGVARRRRR